MTAIKHSLQREVFFPNEERLLSVVHVNKDGKKKKMCFLCIAVTTEKPVQVTVYQVKKNDKGDAYKKKFSWPLRQLRILDAKYFDRDSSEFEITFDKPYKWVASSISEKYAFIQSIWRLSQTYQSQRPEFINVPAGLFEDLSSTQSLATEQLGKLNQDVGMNDWQALTGKEEADLEKIMENCEFAIRDAEGFAEQLSKDLSVLDGANIHSIMGSEEQVMSLMLQLDVALTQVESLDITLAEYANKLQGVKELMDMMRDKDALISIRNRNHKKLMDELDIIVNKLSLDHTHVKALMDGDLSTARGVQACTLAANALLRINSAEIHPSLESMAAIRDQRKKFTSLRLGFTKHLSHHLNNLFIHMGNELGGGTLTMHTQDSTKLPRHGKFHRELLPYAELMSWLRNVDVESCNKLKKVYTSNISKLYESQLKEFMNTAKQHVPYSKLDKKGSFSKPISNASSSSSISKLESQSTSTLKTDESEIGLTSRNKFDQIYENVLTELELWCNAEQDFCIKFFDLVCTEDSPTNTSLNSLNELSSPGNVQKTKSDKQKIGDEIRLLMADIFTTFETELKNFESYGMNIASMNMLYMLVRMSNHVLKGDDANSFLSKTFASSLVQLKRNFDKFIQMMIEDMNEYKVIKKSRVGIIQFVLTFEDFAKQAENIYRNTERRNDLDKAYLLLVASLSTQIARVANESQKTPLEVVQLENFHRLFAILSNLKIASLDAQRKEAKQKYQDWMHAYIVAYFGQPLEKVHIFFVGIEAKIAAGVRLEDIGFQLQYSRQELKKIIKEYTGKEVKKGLELLYKKVEKHLSDEENLLQVVWHSMQDEFIKQYKYFEVMIGKCYPESGISFEFSINDLLAYFSDIAQSH